MNKRMSLWLALLFLLSTLLVACSSTSRFDYAVDALPASLDPQLARTSAEQTAAVNLFEGLYRRSTDGSPTLAAAQSVAISMDGLQYTFTLRENLYWKSYRKNGQTVQPPLTADDFVFAFERIFQKQTGSPWATVFSSILHGEEVLAGTLPPSALGVKALSERELQITLSFPDPALPEKLTLAGAMPCNRDYFESTQGSYGLTAGQTLTNGPFYVTLWKPDSSLNLRRNGKTSSGVEVFRMLLPGEGSQKSPAERYAAGEGDGTFSAGLPQGKAEQAYAFNTTTWVLVFNTEIPFLSRLEIRQAFALSAYDAPLHLAAEGRYTPALGLLPPGVAGLGSEPRLPLPGGSPASLLRQGLAAAAEQQPALGSIPTLTITLPDGDAPTALVDEISQRWQRDLSAYFPTQKVPMEELQKKIDSGDFSIALLPLTTLSSDGVSMLELFNESTGNPSRWQSPEFSQALAALGRDIDSSLRQQEILQTEQLLLENWPVIPIAHESSLFITRYQYSNLSVYPFGPVLDFSAPPAGLPAASLEPAA